MKIIFSKTVQFNEINSLKIKITTCPRGEIGRHKGLKTPGIHKLNCLRRYQVVSKHY